MRHKHDVEVYNDATDTLIRLRSFWRDTTNGPAFGYDWMPTLEVALHERQRGYERSYLIDHPHPADFDQRGTWWKGTDAKAWALANWNEVVAPFTEPEDAA